MEVKKLNPTATATFKVKGRAGTVETVTFTVRMLGIQEIPDYVPKPGPGVKFRQSRIVQDAIIDVIDGWDITLDGQPLACTEENKREYLPQLLGLKVIREGEEPKDKFSAEDLLGAQVLIFAGDVENFIKN